MSPTTAADNALVDTQEKRTRLQAQLIEIECREAGNMIPQPKAPKPPPKGKRKAE